MYFAEPKVSFLAPYESAAFALFFVSIGYFRCFGYTNELRGRLFRFLALMGNHATGLDVVEDVRVVTDHCDQWH